MGDISRGECDEFRIGVGVVETEQVKPVNFTEDNSG